ncbi:dihydrolipoyl dehydrogenase [Sinanaerobacter chloroacetimidivorans]|jgi:dihydrolipoamide dehydrogenase|uniref:Dihydrolipoyl dehydrogenase n=1 Tax=Sinanaerobacter chloroacetimidivorans TaxID=2818044 RepID=A0A8J7W5W3_9FIRM|nr:dihydrolipoyl dehydrogenase [Sinanaerobacter chloroacetimidivorans]MBR0599908.1 dihydrolipoyl dehydrogenase [Sinanaerobacter chloroacetimidivorans]
MTKMTQIILNKLSGEDKTAKVGKILIKAGQKIEEGDGLFNAESAKGNFLVKSEYEGTLLNILIEEGQQIKIGAAIAEIDGEKVTKKPAQMNKTQANKGYSFGLAKPKKEDISCDIAVIGGGPGGYVSAIRAAQLGGNVVLIEKNKLGGTCLNTGCIPTKSFVKSAHLYDEIQRSTEFGIKVNQADVDLKQIVSRKNEVVSNLTNGIRSLLDYWKVRVIEGEAEVTKDMISVKNNKIEAAIQARNIIIATGSSPAKLNIPGAELPVVLTNEEILNLARVPESLTVVGGGVIGMEFAFIFSSFGCKVTVIEYLDDILFNFDGDIIEVIKEECGQRGIRLYTKAKVEEIDMEEGGQAITAFTQEGERHYVVGEAVLMSVGRKPNLSSIDLAELGVDLNAKQNGIDVDEHMATSNPAIYAIGDITNKIQLAHVASHQGIIAAENCMGRKSVMDYTAIPSAVFLSPEIGVVGLCEKEAKRAGIPYKISKFPFAANGKALSQGEPKGFVKILYREETHQILGAAVIGPGATDLISNFTYFIQSKMDYRTLHHTVFAHPTTAESVHEAILGITGEAIHFV